MLCDICMRMFQHEVQDGEYEASGDHHQDLASFTSAVANECYVCGSLLSLLKNRFLLENFTPSFQYTTYGLITFLRYQDTVIQRYDTSLPPNSFSNLTIRGRRADVAMSHGIEMAKIWMHACLEEHQHCEHRQSPRVYPTRLLDLKDSTLHLIIPKETNIEGPFAALSYCWGPDPTFLRLTSSNARQIAAGIVYADLPIAFQEAIQLAMALGIHYIWIDCLCIIQSGTDHEEDWLRESARMQDVYTNCTVNISLARAANPYESCFEIIGPDAQIPFKVDIHSSANREEAESRALIVIPLDYFVENLYNLPLGKRAWVLQERILAPRVLSFGRGELFWECTQRPDASECFPDGLDPGIRQLLHIRTQIVSRTLDDSKLEMNWYELLNEYTKRLLTNPEKDKLVAISAISTMLEDAMNDKCIAGHFLKHLPRSLLWVAAGDCRRIQNCAPSWSWASMDHHSPHLAYVGKKKDQRSVADLLSYHIEPNRFGSSEQISLRIKTFGVRLDWKEDHHRLIEKPGVWIYFTKEQLQWDVRSEESDHENLSILIVLIARQSWRVTGIMLSHLETEERQQHKRLGWFETGLDKAALDEARLKQIFQCDSDEPWDMFHAVAQLHEHEKETFVLV